MSNIDLTFSNSTIRDYFEGKQVSPPISEFLHSHTHPAQFTFLTQIEALTAEMVKAIQGKTEEQLKSLPESFALNLSNILAALSSEVHNVTYKNSETILSLLRGIYKMSKEVIGEGPQFEEVLSKRNSLYLS